MAGVGKSRYSKNRYYKRKLYFPTGDRILLHLLEYVGYEHGFALPDEMTQFGIADGIQLGRSTVSKAIRRLITKGLVRAARAHVPSGKLRRTVYVLTAEGVDLANRRRREVEEEIILFRDGTGADRKLRAAELPKLVSDYATLLDVATHVSEGVFDATKFRGRRGRLVDMTDRVPRLRYFYGREAELASMDEFLSSPVETVLAIRGIAGIGKTTLLARKIEDWKKERPVLFHRIMEWTTMRNVVHQLAEFLARLGRKQLLRHLDSGDFLDIEETISIVSDDLRSVRALLVYDDFHNAEAGIRKLFRGLRIAMEGADHGSKLIVAGRTIPPFYGRREVKVQGVVQEIKLDGLDEASSGKLLHARNFPFGPEEVHELHEKTAGHPLFLELIDPASASRAMEIGRYLQEELFSRVTEDELKVLQAASVFRYPVHADALIANAGMDLGTIRSLLDQSLLREVTSGVYDVHDVLRGYLHETLTPRERNRLHRWAARLYLSRSQPDALEALYHLIEAGDSTSAARVAVKEGTAIRKSGRSEDLLLLLDRLLPTISDPAHSAELRLQKAHGLDVRGELNQAKELYGEIAGLPQEGALLPTVAEAHSCLGDILRREGQLESASAHMETALRLYRAIDHVEGQVETLMLKGRLEEDRSDYPNAKSLYATAIEFANTRGLRAREAEAHFDFSRVLSTEGDHVGSLERKMRALELAEGIADWHLQARFQVSLGANLIELRRYEEARMAYDRAIETARRIGDLRMLAYGVFNAARARISRGDLQQGEAYLKESEALFRKLREPVMTGLVLASYGALWEKRGKWQLAKHYLLTGLDSLRQGAHDFDFARNAQVAAFYFHKHGDRESALALLDEALTVSQRLQLPSLAEGIQSVMNDFAQRLVVPTGARPMLEGRYRTT